MAGIGKVIVGCKHGEEDPDSVAERGAVSLHQHVRVRIMRAC